jgi:hypothetical protein
VHDIGTHEGSPYIVSELLHGTTRINQATGGGKTNGSFVNTIIGGTGKFKDLRGTIRSNNVSTFAQGKATSNDTQYEGEYWMER